MNNLPQTLLEAIRYFSDVDVCHTYMSKIKWPNGVTCPYCESKRIGKITTRKMLRCKDCRKQFSYKVGTIFEDSPLGLDKWFVAVWSIANCKNGISSHELGRALGITQKTAWFMLHRIREAMKTGTFQKLRGEIESDETFVGGEAKNMHTEKREQKIQGRGAVGKAIVHGILERGGPVKASVVPNTESNTLCPIIRQNVESGSSIYTDSNPSYNMLALTHWHQTVNHATEYVNGRVHTNGMENFWSLLKRAIKGTYVSVAEFHLSRYLDEQVFRFNNRKTNDGGRFWKVLQAVVGKRLTYQQLATSGE